MLMLALLFLVLAIVAYSLGETGLGGMAASLAKLFLILFVVLLLFSVFLGGPWGWPVSRY
jgi:uncharacterized membrane protein YtjA (UPF0391 family)